MERINNMNKTYQLYENKVVVITGGSAGIGRAVAIEFAKRGFLIGVLARDSKRLIKTENDIQKHGGRGLGIICDVSDYSAVETSAKKIEEKLGPIDIWINNATVTVFSEFKNLTPQEFKRVNEVTYLGTVYGTMTALKRMLPRDNGIIVQVGSALSYHAIPLQSAYCGAKFGIRGFTDSLRTELMHNDKKITITMIHLPGINTPQFSWSRTRINYYPQPVPPIYQPEVAAKAIVWATEHKRREVWVGSETAATIIMNKFFPRLTDAYLTLTGYESQFFKKAKQRVGNLFREVSGDFSSHGIFDNKARTSSMQFFFEKIPVVHYFSNIFFTFFKAAMMTPKFLEKWLQKQTNVMHEKYAL